MQILSNNTQKRILPRAFGTALLAMLVLASTLVILVQPSKITRAADSFTFTAAGDYAKTGYTTANLQDIAGSGASFNLGLGDFNYDPTGTTTDQWSTYLKSNL